MTAELNIVEDGPVVFGLIRDAVAQAWCTPENAHKVMDEQLAWAAIHKVYSALREAGIDLEHRLVFHHTDEFGSDLYERDPLEEA